MDIQLNIDPTSTTDLDQAESVIAALRFAQGGGDPDGLLAAAGQQSLKAVLQQLANPNRYGENRLGYLRRVALAGDAGVPIAQLLEQHFDGNHNGYGGTHSSIERSWAALGGQQWAAALISESADYRQIMYGPAIPIVLELVGDEATAKESA